MIEHGKVIKANKNRITVRIPRHEACEGCNACGMGKNHLDVIIANDNSLAVGDSVEIELKLASDRIFAVIAYLVPMLFMAVGLIIGVLCNLHELITIAIALTALTAGIVAAYYLDKYFVKIKKLNPSVKKTEQINQIEQGEIEQ